MRDKGKLIAVIDEGTKTARVVVCIQIKCIMNSFVLF